MLVDLQPALAAGGHAVTVAVHGGRDLIAVWPGFVDVAYGVAVDVGSTTIAGHLCELGSGEVLATAGAMNPQIRFGEDLMSRVSYVMMNPDGRVQLTDAVQGAVDELVGRLTEEAGVERDDVLDLVAVGNPIMHHLLLGIDPTPLGTAPFALATDLAVDARAADIGVRCRRARLHVLPCIAGHVGADAAAAMLAEGPHRSDEVQLLVDVGTNAEIVLGQRQWLLAASSPTGPALEGAQISCGQRATPGAIERVRIDRDTLEPRIRVVGGDRWSDEDGLRGAPSARRASPACAARGSSRSSPSCSWPGCSTPTAPSTARWPHARLGSSRTAGSSRTCCTTPPTVDPRCASPRTTCAPSSWPRPRCRRACGC